MGKVTIDTICRATGYSRGTISRALNNKGDISQATRQRVLQICTELRFTPNQVARSLATGRYCCLVILLDDVRSSFSGAFLSAAFQEAWQHQHALRVVELGHSREQASERLALLSCDGADGAIVAAALDPQQLALVRERLVSRPVALCNGDTDDKGDVRRPDHGGAGRMAADFLLERGSPQLYLHSSSDPFASQRLLGFQEGCRARGVDPAELLIDVPAAGSWRESLQAPVEKRMRAAAAMAASSDALAIDALLIGERLGRTAGKEYCLLGYGNRPIGTQISPALSTIDPDPAGLARWSVRTAIGRLNRELPEAFENSLAPPLLVPRASSRPS